MLKNVFLKTLRDQRMSFAWWAVGVVSLCLFVAALYPSVTRTPSLTEFFDQAPEWVKAFMGGSIEEYTSPAGYLHGELFYMMAPILFLIFAISRGSAAIAGEEGKGTLDLLLANPIPRWRVVVEKAASMAAALFFLGAVLWAALTAGAGLVRMDISPANLAAASLSCMLLGLIFGALALTLGCLTGRRGQTIGIAAATAVGTFLLNSLAHVVEGLKPWSRFSPFYYYIESEPLKNGLNGLHVLVLLAVSAALVGLAVFFFQRRDIGIGSGLA